MAEDPNPVLRAELNAAIAVLDPQIRGLDDMEHVSVSPELRAQFSATKKARIRRRDLCQAVLNNLDATFNAIKALEADGYPNLPPVAISPNLMTELGGQDSDLDEAIKLFEEDKSASTIAVELGAPTAKT